MSKPLIENLSPFIREVWNKSGFKNPTSIQEMSIPIALEGKDLIAESPTGTGKTLGYLLPVLQKIEVEKRNIQAVILASSQELVMQILAEIQKWAEGSGIRAASFIGGANAKRQLEKLKKSPHVIVGTPGRTLELIKQKKMKMHEVKTVVLDEADQLFVPEHENTVRQIIKSTLGDRQILLFSATLTKRTEEIAREIAREPEIIRITKDETIDASTVEHAYVITEQRDKINFIEKLSRISGIKGLVFVRDIGNLNVLAEKLKFKKVNAEVLHSDLGKMDRQAAIRNFRTGKSNLLLATDIAARGLDIQGITHVIHYDFPRDLNQYVHRSGRTGRFGASGTVLAIVTDREERDLKKFARELGISITEKVFFKSEIVDKQNRNRS
ncbi:RNA helicase [Bacillus canaveralius]|uniref:RNA helicase n=1 Tax=Bacillus canaveralius TaxID=1403243 RepID=A0A2N5GG02_9BACI|nr:DEAD/DEAH box helicase [Bacillus canaveralius]PLR79688.1 RNA helicase [Bacillus canaveralius]PLR91988.1 RNA helicase [Bacillus canaveralius]